MLKSTAMRKFPAGVGFAAICWGVIWAGATLVAAGEMRTWTAASGLYTVEAEFVEMQAGDVVLLRTKAGGEIKVPLGQLSAADQAIARPAAIAATTVMPEKPSQALTRAVRAADRCRLPEEAIVILKVFHDDPQTPAGEKAYAAGRLAELKDYAAKNLVRVNKKWIARAEADAVRKKADELMRQGLALLRLEQEEGFKKKFGEAAGLEPESVRADFLMGLIYTLTRQGGKALPVFQKCLTRDPENIAVLNNVAMLAAAKREYNTALSAWRRAMDLHPDQRIVHNVGRFLEQCTATNINVPKNVRDALALPYTTLTASGRFEPTAKDVGWLMMLIETSDLDIDLDDEKSKVKRESPAPKPNDDGTVVGSGTGFVFHPGYIMTNAHVAMNDANYEIQAPDGTLHKATRIAADEKLDLAILKCEAIKAPPLVLQTALVPRGTDVMLFGYPEMLALGTSLKATRGSISSLPDPSIDSKYLYDAVSNSGNSGGPLCDSGANVVAVHSTGYNTASRYAGGIPSTQAIEFVRKSLPEYQPTVPATAKLEWPQVDEKASASTMLIWIRKKNAAAPSASFGGENIELPFCLFCGGFGKLRCDNPACKEGFVQTKQGRLACTTCNGAVVYECGVCDGVGIDVQLASVKRAIEAAAAAGSTSATPSPTTTASTPNTPPNANPTAQPVNPIDEPMPEIAKGRAIELLSTVNPDQQYSPGNWVRQGKVIVGGKVDNSRLAVPYQPPPEYDVLVAVQMTEFRAGTSSKFQMGLVSATGRQFQVAIESKYIHMSTSPNTGAIQSHTGFDYRRPLQIRYLVRRNEVTVVVNDVRLFQRKIDPDQISVWPNYQMAGEDTKRLFIGSHGDRCQWAITTLIVIPVD